MTLVQGLENSGTHVKQEPESTEHGQLWVAKGH